MTGSRRLLFEPLCAEHARGLFGPLSDPRVDEHIDDTPPENVAALAARFAIMAAGPPAHRSRERWVNFAVKLAADGVLIGRLEATIVDGRAEVAYLFDPQFWGQGYAGEAMIAFQDHLRQNECVAEFWATTMPRNGRSIGCRRNWGTCRLRNRGHRCCRMKRETWCLFCTRVVTPAESTTNVTKSTKEGSV
ncbi:MAG: GNAT family N-acetyltransferase [Planctomycetaceae bacterium]